ncbi:MAG: DUF4085 family protein [Blastocatellia bacterium]
MKHQTEKPSEKIMRFFTPELYLQFNSPDEAVADRADEAWEKAIHKYQRHLQSIRPKLPSQVKEVAELSLHDAEVLAFEREMQPGFPLSKTPVPFPIWYAFASLSLKQNQTILSLLYILGDHIQEYPAKEDWQFSRSDTHWLYDEVDLDLNHQGMFLHRILFSDGRIFEIPFMSVVVSRFSLPATDEAGTAKRIA